MYTSDQVNDIALNCFLLGWMSGLLVMLIGILGFRRKR